jgi:hypothetical protein
MLMRHRRFDFAELGFQPGDLGLLRAQPPDLLARGPSFQQAPITQFLHSVI